MSLRLSKFDQNGVSILNRWAEDQHNKTQAHEKEIASLKVLLQQLKDKNPNLQTP